MIFRVPVSGRKGVNVLFVAVTPTAEALSALVDTRSEAGPLQVGAWEYFQTRLTFHVNRRYLCEWGKSKFQVRNNNKNAVVNDLSRTWPIRDCHHNQAM